MNNRMLYTLLLLSTFGFAQDEEEISEEITETQQPEVTEQPAVTTSSWQPSTLPDDGLTTVNEERGNWVFKREILKKARPLYENIRTTVTAVDGLKKSFVDIRSAVDATANTFYSDFGFQQGEIDERIDILTKEIEQKKEAVQDRQLLAELQEKKKEVENLKKQLGVIQEIESNLNRMMTISLDQIDQAHSYEQKAWGNYDRISEILSDEVAHNLLLEMQALKTNIDAIHTYLTQELLPYGEKMSKQVTEEMARLKTTVEDLKNRGILLQQRMEDKEKTSQKPAKVAESQGWFSYIMSSITAPFVYVYRTLTDGIASIISLFTGKQPEPQAPALEPARVSPVIIDQTQPQHPQTVESIPSEPVEPEIETMPQPPSLPTAPAVTPEMAESAPMTDQQPTEEVLAVTKEEQVPVETTSTPEEVGQVEQQEAVS